MVLLRLVITQTTNSEDRAIGNPSCADLILVILPPPTLLAPFRLTREVDRLDSLSKGVHSVDQELVPARLGHEKGLLQQLQLCTASTNRFNAPQPALIDHTVRGEGLPLDLVLSYPLAISEQAKRHELRLRESRELLLQRCSQMLHHLPLGWTSTAIRDPSA